MKPIWKHIILVVSVLLVIIYMVCSLRMSHHAMESNTCAHFRIMINDLDERQYVSEEEIVQLIQDHGLDPIGKSCSQWSIQGIEDMVGQHSMVRTAECYPTVDGKVCVSLTQRIPLVQIRTDSANYFIDTDRKQMPIRSSVTTVVPLVCGQVDETMASHEVADFAEWLLEQPYWQQRIACVEVYASNMIYIRQTENRATIILGEWQDFAQKLTKLSRWYGAENSLDLAQYPVVDVRYDGQVVGIKENIIYANKKK